MAWRSRQQTGGGSGILLGSFSDELINMRGTFDLTRPAISKHLDALAFVGLITRSKRARFRPCTLAAGPLARVVGWTDQYRHIRVDRFDRMEDHVREVEQTDKARSSAPTA